MDDKNFDKKTAQEWIEMIESSASQVREMDLYPRLQRWVGDVPSGQILDIGCGQGICSEKINLQNHTYVGVEPSQFLIARAKEKYPEPQKQFVVGNAYSLPFSADAFEAAFSIALWHLLEDKRRAANELSRVLKAGGLFLIATAHPDCYAEWEKTYYEVRRDGPRLEGRTRLNDGTDSVDVLYLHPYNEIIASLKAVGLEVSQTSQFRTVLLIQGSRKSK